MKAYPTVRIDLDTDAYLRTLVPEDVTEAYVEGLNDPLVHEFLEGPRLQRQTNTSVRTYVRKNAESADSLLLGLYLNNELRGTIRLHDIGPPGGTAWVGIALFDRSTWRRGWATRMLLAVIGFARNELHLAQLSAGIRHGNIASESLFTKAGFNRNRYHKGDSSSVWVLCLDDSVPNIPEIS